MLERKLIYTGLVAFLIFTIGISPTLAWEPPIVIAGKTGHEYDKPEIGYGPDGAVYITYRDKTLSGGNSDIFLCRYDGKNLVYENVSQGATFWPKHKAYQSDNEVTADGRVHVAWVDHDKTVPNIHYVKYRYKDGNTWSDIVTINAMHMHEDDFAFDLRLGVCNNGNVHIVLQWDDPPKCKYFAMYGNTILPMESLDDPRARVKHPDIAVDDNNVHIIWMKKIGWPYAIFYQKRQNLMNGTKGPIKQLTFANEPFSSQKSRIDVSSDGLFHLAEFLKTGTVKKLKYYKEQPDGTLSKYVTVSDPNTLKLYHWAGLEVRDNSIIATMQLGSSYGGRSIFYNWNKNGVWGGITAIPGTAGACHTSVDLSEDGEIAAVAYQKFLPGTAIMLVSSDEISGTGVLTAEFSNDDRIFWGSAVTLDASECNNLNPDHNIINYEWDFGDGSIDSTSSPTVQHSFLYPRVMTQVTLTITSESGASGSISKDIYIHALWPAIINNITPKRIRTVFYDKPGNEISWSANPQNTDAGYPAITSYEICRALTSSGFANDNYINVGEVNATITTFLDYFDLQENTQYVYSIRSVDAEGHVSPFENISVPTDGKSKADIDKIDLRK
jgi:hypothetical protein